MRDAKSQATGSPRACDAEPIHVPGSIQSHGLLLLFDAATDRLVHWAGDPGQLPRAQIEAGASCREVLGMRLGELSGALPAAPGQQAIFAGTLRPASGLALSMMVHRTGALVAVELEPAPAEAADAATSLQRLRNLSHPVASAPTLETACRRAAEAVQAIAGYDRVMIYRFGEDYSGSVVAEALKGTAGSYLHHRFPASDIPSQARELYRRNPIRVIADVASRPAPLQPPVEASAIDLSQSTLRSVSPVHIRYLRNMGVGASMSISLLVDGRLWGLIACHHPAARPVPAQAQLMCREIGETLSAYVRTQNLAERAGRSEFHSSVLEQLMRDLRASSDPEQGLRSSATALHRLVDSGGVALMARGEMAAGTGQLPDAATLRSLCALIEARLDADPVLATDCLDEDIGGCPEAIPLASGVLAVRIEGVRPLIAIWTRPEQVEEVLWAGNPRLKDGSDDPAKALTPRHSFDTWREVVQGRSRPWMWEEKATVEAFKARTEYILQRHRLEQVNRQLAEANRHLAALATTDPLTGLPNRRLFDERLRTEWARCLRSDRPLAMIAIDVDNFKKYNDRFGHPAGDACLKQVADALSGACRAADVAARVGGEEFALLLPDVDRGAAGAIAERIRAVVEALAIAHPLNGPGVVTISLGLAEGTPAEWGDLESFLKAADEALYEAKNNGRNRHVAKPPPSA